MAYGDFKDLTRQTASDKIFYDKAFNIVKNLKYYGFFLKKTSGSGIKNENISNKKVAKNYRNQLLEILMKEKYTYLL